MEGARSPRGAMAPRGLRDVLFGAQAPEGRVWPHVVIVTPPVLAELPGVPQALEAVLVEQLVSRAAVEALGEGVLNGLPRADEVVLDAVAVGPGVERAAGELGPVVAADRPRLAVGLDGLVEGPLRQPQNIGPGG